MDRKFNKYKLVTDYNEWKKTHKPDKVYCVTRESGELLFDVYEDDFIEMVDNGLVNSEGRYFLLNDPTDEQIAEYAAKYGIWWTDFDTHYWRIDLSNKTKGGDDYSLLFKTERNKQKDEIERLLKSAGVFFDKSKYSVTIEDITYNQPELEYWKKLAKAN